MLGGIHTDLLVTVTLLFLTQTGTQCRAENDFSLVTLPDRRTNAEYVTQCFHDQYGNLVCDWTRNQLSSATAHEDVAVNILESGPLGLEGEACLEFWFLAPVAAKGSELRALLKSSTGLVEIWTSPVLPRDSWRQVFVPLNVTDAGTKVVFEAVQAAFVERQVAFDQIGVRRGSCGHQCESHTEFWTDDSTRCVCSVGQLSCSPSQCPQGQICGPQRQGSSGISATGTCTIHSNTDCSSFDGVLFRFMAPCTYILAKTCLSTEALPAFSVEVVNKQNGNSSLPSVQQVIVKMTNFRVSLLKRQTRRVVVNGVWKKLPLKLSSGTITIKSNPAAVTLGTRFGLSVSYDSAGAVHVNLPPAYSDQVCGLCGNFNNLRDDDFRMPDGTTAQNVTALAKSWQTGETTSSCETILVPHQCDPLEEVKYASELNCGGIVSTTGPFAACLSLLGAESYFRDCVVGMCSTHGDPAVLCNTLQAYTDICQEAGVAIPIWRNSTFCSLQCAENSHFNSCADGCPEVCSSMDIADSCGSCEERCECDSGFKLSGGMCVPAEDCGCWYNGKHYERGETFLEGECVKQCHCMGNNEVQCATTQCAHDEVCKVKDGVKGCFPFSPATCSVYGDPHFITFDGMAYDFQGGCSYTLTTTCGGESSAHFTVIGYNMYPPLQNFTRSKLEAAALQVEDLYLILNQSGAVNVNNVRVQLPYSTNGTYGSVWVYMKNNYIILETTFGLRMMIDGQYRLFVQVDERYKYELCGLCGTYSEQQEDDFITPEGQNATGPFEFGDSWRVQGDNQCIANPNDPRVCDYVEENDAYDECYTLLREVFEPCHELVHPSIYLSSCVYDYCATSGDQHTLCESLKSYAVACEVAGVELPHWQTNTACADPQTTATPSTTPPPTSPTPDQTFCPINCNFEKNLCGWEQLIQDSFDWTRHSGPTPSILTGPNEDHTTGAGFYMYTEGNSATYGDSARLLSSMCHYNGPLCLQFWYHMYGSAAAMALNIYLLKDNKATKIWSMRNNQGPKWHPGHIDIRVSGPFRIIVEGIRGSDAQSDVALDDIYINFGSCSGNGLVSGTVLPSTTIEILPSYPDCNMDCSFDSNLCSWNQMMSDAFDWTWQSGSTPTLMTGPSADHTGNGHYLYIEASNVTHGDTARLISSECFDSGPRCLQFWYHMHGSADTMGLTVYLLQNKVAEAIWWKRNDQGNMWQLAQVDFTTTDASQIIIEGRRGSNEESDVAIDDVKLYLGQCSGLSGVVTNPPKPDGDITVHSSVPVPTTATSNNSPPPPHQVCHLHCNFDQDLCHWSQLLADVFDWTRHHGSTPTMMTGPSSDHTTGDGHYLYIEANSAWYGDTARLISSECSDSGPQCLQFWYHMYGSADTMGLHVYLLQGSQADAIWRKRNDQGNMWHLAQVDLTTNGAFQIIFEGRRGSNDESDVAIDDVFLHRGHCADQSQTTAPATTTPVITEGPGHPTASDSTTTQPQISTSLTTMPPSTFTTTMTTITATTDCDTQTTTTATTVTPMTSNTDVPTTRPQLPITSEPITIATTGHQTTARPHPPTTEHEGVETSEQPEPEITEKPQTTAIPEQPVTSTNEPQPPTTAKPQPTTEIQPQTTAQPQPTTTVKPQPPTTAMPKPPTTGSLQPPTETQPQPQTTVEPQPPTTAKPQPPTTGTLQPPTETHPQTTAQPQPPTTDGPQRPTETQPQTTVKPEPPTTVRPQLTTTARPQPPTTARPQHPTTARPQPSTTPGPQPSTTARPQPSTTPGPQPSTTSRPQPTTTARPQHPTTAGPQLPTTARPQPTTTARPQPTTTARPQPTTTARPQPTTTARPQPATTAGQQSSTAATATPKPLTTVGPQFTTAGPHPTTTATPQPTATAKPQTTLTAQPQATTTAGPQPPTVTVPQPQTTIKPQPPATTTPLPATTVEPQTTTTATPPPTTTDGPQPPTETLPQPQTTVKPQPPATATPKPTTVGPQPTTTATPQPPTTTSSQPPTSSPQPATTTSLPTPSCPQNSHYTTCIPSCSPTCTHLNGLPHCSDHESCVKGCVCNEGFVQKGRVCVPIQQCGCVDRNGDIHQFNTVWYTSHCSQKCKCKKDDGMGKIVCDHKDECDGNAVCLQNEEGNYYCQFTGFNECTIRRLTEYRTFDKMNYDFKGEHSYVLVMTKNLPNNLPDVYIEGISANTVDDDNDSHYQSDSEGDHSRMFRDEDNNEDDNEDDDDENDEDDDKHDDDSDEHEEDLRLRELKIIVYNHTVEFKKKLRLVVDGRRTGTPVSPTAGLKIYKHSSRIYLMTDFGLSVEFDGQSIAEFILPRIYKRKVGGLCGNFDGQKQNDWMKPDGTRARTAREFGESWRV